MQKLLFRALFGLVLLIGAQGKDLDDLSKKYEKMTPEEAKESVGKMLKTVTIELETWKNNVIEHKGNMEKETAEKLDKIAEFRENFKGKFGLKRVNEELPRWHRLEHEVQKTMFYSSILNTVEQIIDEQLSELQSTNDLSVEEMYINIVRARGISTTVDKTLETSAPILQDLLTARKKNEKLWPKLETMNKGDSKEKDEL